MTPITIIMLTFSLLGIIDLIIGNKFGLGEQFERGIMLLGPMAMSMIGMLVLAPLIAHVLQPVVGWITTIIPMEPSVIPSMFLATIWAVHRLRWSLPPTMKSDILTALSWRR